MPAFNDEPLSCLAFTGDLDDENTLFSLIDEKITFLSAISAINSYVLNVTRSLCIEELNGRKLQFLAGITPVLASRYAKGSLVKFIERLVCHLTFNQVNWKLKEGEL
jgi:hypothetical protein